MVRGGGGELLDEGAGDGIEKNTRAFPAGDLIDASDQVLLRGGDDMVGAEFVQLFPLL